MQFNIIWIDRITPFVYLFLFHRSLSRSFRHQFSLLRTFNTIAKQRLLGEDMSTNRSPVAIDIDVLSLALNEK